MAEAAGAATNSVDSAPTGQWRGYHAVTTYNGADDAQTGAKATYYQGMDGDKPRGGTRSVIPGGQHTDANPLAGNVLENTAYKFKGGPVDHSTIDSSGCPPLRRPAPAPGWRT